MKKCLVVLVLIVAMSVCSIGYAYDGKGSGNRPLRNELLNQLPTDKETLLHQTMREVREKTANIREQIRDLKAEINDILIAPEFNEVLFLEKTKSLQELHQTIRDAKEKAIAKLAGQFNQEERKILAKLIHQKHRYHGRQPGR
jgi:uncharacterized membrane protein